MEDKRMRIALVNQRYGLEVNGGSEYYTRMLAEHLSKVCDVEILTTKALDYQTWGNFYEADVEILNGITVRRFSTEHPRHPFQMRLYSRLRYIFPKLKQYFENRWIDAQGPYAPGLIRYIENYAEQYSLIIFVTYLYYHTVRGIPAAKRKAVLLPTAHDEPYIHFSIYQDVFAASTGLVYLTQEEKELVESLFPVSQRVNCVVGTGISLPDKIDSTIYREKYGLHGKYLIYVGRIDESKGCREMFRIFRDYKRSHPGSKLSLVLMGKSVMEIPETDDILYQGFVSEEDKYNGISGAEALWLPSQYESLSLSVLEAMALGIPVVVNGQCQVLKGHCERSGGGLAYKNREEAVKCLEMLEKGRNREEMSNKAKIYVMRNYQWDKVVDRMRSFLQELNRIINVQGNNHE